MVASTFYHLRITMDSSRVPRYYINGVLVETGSALTNTLDTLIPYIGVQASGAAEVKNFDVYEINASRLYGN